MIVKPKVRGFMCVTAHPAGCEAHVREQIDYVKGKGAIEPGPKKVLVVGASTGYGLASRITAAFGSGAGTVGAFLEKGASEKRTATAGWYNSIAFERAAHEIGIYAKSVNGDAFSDEIKAKTVDLIRNDLGSIDLVVYSLASPRRTHPKTGHVAKACLKPIGQVYEGHTLDTDKAAVKDVRLEPATDADIADTVAVMGGEDWEMWIDALESGGVLAEGCQTISYTYIGTKLTWPIYWEGTIGQAKHDLDRAAKAINQRLGARGGAAYIAVMKALVTQSSSAIPVVPLYISLLYRVMKERGGHEGTIEQVQRLFATQLYGGGEKRLDDDGRIRMDDLEMVDDIQNEVSKRWPEVSTANLRELTDFSGYQAEFLKMFGFGLDDIDYDAEVDPMLEFETIVT